MTSPRVNQHNTHTIWYFYPYKIINLHIIQIQRHYYYNDIQHDGEAGYLRRHRAHYDVVVMNICKWYIGLFSSIPCKLIFGGGGNQYMFTKLGPQWTQKAKPFPKLFQKPTALIYTKIYNASDTEQYFDLFQSKLIAMHNKCFPEQMMKNIQTENHGFHMRYGIRRNQT